MGFAGLNLTVPHKLLAVDMVDALDESAKIWGAVNTIRFDGGAGILPANLDHTGKMPVPLKTRAVGFNTDAERSVTGAARRFGDGAAWREGSAARRGRGRADGGVETCVGKHRGTFSRQPDTKQGGRDRERNKKAISVRQNHGWLSKSRRGFDFKRHFARLEGRTTFCRWTKNNFR